MKKNARFETRAIKSAENDYRHIESVSTPIYLSTTYRRQEDGSYVNDFAYARGNNPNRHILEKSLAELENGEIAFAFSSGMAAISSVFQSLKTGDHVLLPDDVYFNIYVLMEEVFSRWGLEFSKADMSDLEEVSNNIRPNTALVWMESPSNPQLKITDIEAVSDLAKAAGAMTAVDNTWPSPVLQNPLDLGADIVVHSTTKYFGGHSDVMGGAVICKHNDASAERIHSIQMNCGAVPSPFDSWLISRGIMSLSTRIMAQTKTAHSLAEFLEGHPKIKQVNYPGLNSHPQHEIAKQQMKGGFGAMLSVLVDGNAKTAMDISNRLQLFTPATSLGGVESLVEHRKSIEGPQSATPENLLRLSVGLEHIEDLKADWDQALNA